MSESPSSASFQQYHTKKFTVEPAIIYFDGVCNLCSGSVQFVLKRDRKEKFMFASLQGENGQALLRRYHFPQQYFDSFILEEGGKLFTRSTAALKVAKALGLPWSLLYVFIIVPPFIRNGLYDLISRNRYKWFGKKEICWIPEPKWEKRFLP
jgi:predicted DCC family thiol-disulfide oxidoreductase YuxK